MTTKPIRVGIVNDSPTLRAALRTAIEAEPNASIAFEARNGDEAIEMVAANKPDVVLMDVVMPVRDGYSATREIMTTNPTPIVLVSSVVNPRDVAVAMEALRSGALSIVQTLPARNDPTYESRRSALILLLRSMSAVDVSRRPSRAQSRARIDTREETTDIAVIGVVASTGGPSALADIFRDLPRDLPPILVVQHITRGFTEGFARWLSEVTKREVVVARDGEQALAGKIYVAPEDVHMGVDSSMHLVMSETPTNLRLRPSGTYLLRSIAESFGRRAVGVVLTGMGDDGADGAVSIRRAGGAVVAQDEETSVVWGMPRMAFERGGADEVLPLPAIANWIVTRARGRGGR